MAGLLRNRQADCTVKCGPDHTALGGPVRAARTVVLSYAVLAVSRPLRLLHPIAGPSCGSRYGPDGPASGRPAYPQPSDGR